MKVRFISLASGSSGNCYYLGTDTYGILIDAGIDMPGNANGTEAWLKRIGIIE